MRKPLPVLARSIRSSSPPFCYCPASPSSRAGGP